MNTYDDYNADVVIAPAAAPIGAYEAWHGTAKLATGTVRGMRFIIAGAIEQEMSVYDAESQCFLVGTIDQLVGVPA